MKSFQELNNSFIKISGAVEMQEKNLEKFIKERDEYLLKKTILSDSISLAKKCVEKSLEQKVYIEDIISSGLSEVYGYKNTFVLEPIVGTDGIIKGLKPRLKEGDGEFDDPINSFGAAAVSIASLCFKISVLLLTPNTKKVLIMDEPLANVSPTLQIRFRTFVENVCEATGLQIIMITHLDQPFGKVLEVVKGGPNNSKPSTVTDITEKLVAENKL